MPVYEPGDYVKVEFKDDSGRSPEWMWVKVQYANDNEKIVFGTLDNEPVEHTDLRLGMELAVHYDKIREHMKPEAFGQ